MRGGECGKGFLRTRDGAWGFGKGFLVVRKRLFEGAEEGLWGCGMGFLRVRKRLFEGVEEALWRGGMGGTDYWDDANG